MQVREHGFGMGATQEACPSTSKLWPAQDWWLLSGEEQAPLAEVLAFLQTSTVPSRHCDTRQDPKPGSPAGSTFCCI